MAATRGKWDRCRRQQWLTRDDPHHSAGGAALSILRISWDGKAFGLLLPDILHRLIGTHWTSNAHWILLDTISTCNPKDSERLDYRMLPEPRSGCIFAKGRFVSLFFSKMWHLCFLCILMWLAGGICLPFRRRGKIVKSAMLRGRDR